MKQAINWLMALVAVLALGFDGWGCSSEPTMAPAFTPLSGDDDGEVYKFGPETDAEMAEAIAKAPPLRPAQRMMAGDMRFDPAHADVRIIGDSPEDIAAGVTDKSANYELFMGWAMPSQLTQRCVDGSGNPINPCQFHLEPLPYIQRNMYDSPATSVCGANIGDSDTRGAPCAIISTTRKIWTWYLDRNSCVDSTISNNLINLYASTAREVMRYLSLSTGWTFRESIQAAGSNLLFQCHIGIDTTTGSQVTQLADGFGYGALTFRGALEDTDGNLLGGRNYCDTATAADLTAGPHAPIGQFVDTGIDEYWSYNGGQINLYFNLLGREMQDGCGLPSDTSHVHFALRSLLLHEMGHVFGFQHYLDGDSQAAMPYNDIMYPFSTCDAMSNNTFWRSGMVYATQGLHVDGSRPVTLEDVGLVCYFPENGDNWH